MGKIRAFQWVSLGVILMLTACQGLDQRGSAALFRSGDNLDGMQLTTGAADASPLAAFCAVSQESSHIMTFNCSAPLLPALAIGHMFLLADEALTALEWSELAWELSINDKAVDLASFGTFEYYVPSVTKNGPVVHEVFTNGIAWNIVLRNLTPGTHVLRFQAHNDTTSYSWLINLNIEPADGTDILSILFPSAPRRETAAWMSYALF